jgi:hypothetical protein
MKYAYAEIIILLGKRGERSGGGTNIDVPEHRLGGFVAILDPLDKKAWMYVDNAPEDQESGVERLIRYNEGDQFCEIVIAKEVETDLQELAAELAEAQEELRKLRPETVVDDVNQERCEDCEQLMYDCECGAGSFRHGDQRSSAT